ncbi:MAG: glycerate kinase, partial [Ignavibacterium sp.]|nr:glycerate kinase [Ignavibacterium sp.]
MKILIAANSFKESLSSVQIAKIFSEEFEKLECEKIILPLSDGGDGFIDVIDFIESGECRSYSFQNEFAGLISENRILINDNSKELFIESANVIGLHKLPVNLRKPMHINSYALGKLIKEILEAKFKFQLTEFSKIIIGVGGTATIDFGLGAAEALGVIFINKNGKRVKPIPENFLQIDDFILPDFSDKLFKQIQIKCVADVDTPLFGFNSAIVLYGQQKGASSVELQKIKKGFEHIAEIMLRKNLVRDISKLNGAGGGLASGLKIFFNAEIIPSKKFIIENLLNRIDVTAIDYLITGEGKFDIQSFEGKATGNLIKNFSDKVKKIFLVCGKIEENVKSLLPENVICFQLLDFYINESEAREKADEGLRVIAQKIIAEYLPDVAAGRYKVIGEKLGCNAHIVQEAVDIIRTLDPKPGRAFGKEQSTYI